MDLRSRCTDSLVTNERADGAGEATTRDEGAGEAVTRADAAGEAATRCRLALIVSSFLLYSGSRLTVVDCLGTGRFCGNPNRSLGGAGSGPSPTHLPFLHSAGGSFDSQLSTSGLFFLTIGTVLTWGFAGVGATESYAPLTPPAAMRE
jgi:hypothetical protein